MSCIGRPLKIIMIFLMNKLQSFVKKTPIGRYLINYQLRKYTAPAHVEIRSEEEYLAMLNNYSKCPGGTVIRHDVVDASTHHQYDLQVVIPVYKVEKYLRECVDSVIMQSTKYRILVVLVDDGSPDECSKICDEYALKDKRIKVIHKQNGGLSSARNAGMKDIVANYIMFVDSDDRLINGSIDKLMGIAYSQKADIVQGSFHGLRGGKPTTKVGYNKTGPIGYTRLLGFAWGKVYKSDYFSTICFPEGFWFEDTINSFLIYPQSKCSWALSDVVYEYRVNDSGIMQQSINNPKCLDTFWITRLSMLERKGEKYKNDLAYFQKLKKQFVCNENRLNSASESVREAVFNLSASALLDVFPEPVDFDGVTNNDRLFEKIIRDRNYKLFSGIARWL